MYNIGKNLKLNEQNIYELKVNYNNEYNLKEKIDKFFKIQNDLLTNDINNKDIDDKKLKPKTYDFIGYRRLKIKKHSGKREININIENQLIDFVNKYIEKFNRFPIHKILKNKAILIYNRKNFLASKGWYNKFKKRYLNNLKIKKEIKSLDININDKNIKFNTITKLYLN